MAYLKRQLTNLQYHLNTYISAHSVLASCLVSKGSYLIGYKLNTSYRLQELQEDAAKEQTRKMNLYKGITSCMRLIKPVMLFCPMKAEIQLYEWFTLLEQGGWTRSPTADPSFQPYLFWDSVMA